LSGGVPVPEPEHLTGSIRPPLRVLTGSIRRQVHLTGSMGTKRRLTGSPGSISYNNKGKKR
jgi:hypothetical protein